MRTQRYASVIGLKPEMEAEYRRLHADVWPGVLEALRRANVRNFSIFLRDGMLFSYLEYAGDDFAGDMATVAQDEATRRWWVLTDPCQQPLPTAEDNQWWARPKKCSISTEPEGTSSNLSSPSRPKLPGPKLNRKTQGDRGWALSKRRPNQ